MLSHATVIRNSPQQDLMNELRVFLKGALKIERPNPLDLTKTALRLLKILPAARNAVFEYFSNVLSETAANYVKAVENEIKTGELPSLSETDEAVVTEIHAVLVTFIADNSTAWAPIISTWSLELLGEISTKFAGRTHSSTNLNATLQLWMNCKATKILVDINTKCLSSLIHSDTEACISALLDTSTKHSPNFDWVVAHVGSSFPNTVITRVLSCGLKDFCQIKSYEQGCNSPKLRSVVGILGHLAGSHSNDIRSAVLEMFEWSLKQNQDGEQVKLQKKSTVPFILQLAYLSDTFFLSICKEINQALTADVIKALYDCIDDWCKYFGSPEILEDVLLTLIVNCDSGGTHIVNLLLDCALIQNCASESMKLTISDKSSELLQNILYKVDEDIRNGKPVGLLSSFSSDNSDDLYKNLQSSDEIRAQTAAKIVVFLGHKNPSILVRAVSHLFQNASTPAQLSLILKILGHELVNKTAWPYADKGGYFSTVLEQISSRLVGKFVNKQDPELAQMWTNLLTLLKWEQSQRVPFLNSLIISRAIQANLVNLTALFGSEELHLDVIAEILDDFDIPNMNKLDNLPIEVILNLTQSTVNYFFVCCKRDEGARKIAGFRRANRILKRLCVFSKVAKVLALRELLERSLFRSDNVLFGTKNNAHFDDLPDKLLLKQNKKINKTIPLTKHSSVFNGGIIGNGKRKLIPTDELPQEDVASNVSELINAIKSCCALPEDTETKYSGVSLESATLVSLLLVQFVSPDVMYNGLPWPDEEFSKVTIERDLFIRRTFGHSPVLWDLLGFVAVHRPALCYCSVLIRALTATLIHQWKSTGDQSTTKTDSYKTLLNTTIKVIDVMALGQLLPPPLSSIRDVLPSLKCYEIVAILKDCIWCYVRDHIPSPALFVCDSNGMHWRDPTLSRPSEAYTNTLRIIMQRNIETLGHMYSQMFINVARHE